MVNFLKTLQSLMEYLVQWSFEHDKVRVDRRFVHYTGNVRN